jgi:hypothetical protein
MEKAGKILKIIFLAIKNFLFENRKKKGIL